MSCATTPSQILVAMAALTPAQRALLPGQSPADTGTNLNAFLATQNIDDGAVLGVQGDQLVALPGTTVTTLNQTFQGCKTFESGLTGGDAVHATGPYACYPDEAGAALIGPTPSTAGAFTGLGMNAVMGVDNQWHVGTHNGGNGAALLLTNRDGDVHRYMRPNAAAAGVVPFSEFKRVGITQYLNPRFADVFGDDTSPFGTTSTGVGQGEHARLQVNPGTGQVGLSVKAADNTPAIVTRGGGSGSTGSGLYALADGGARGVTVDSTSTNNALHTRTTGTGGGVYIERAATAPATHALVVNDATGEVTGSDTIYAVSGMGTTTPATSGRVLSVVSGPNGTRPVAVEITQVAANTTWALSTNGAIFAAGGVTTSDKKLKRNIKAIDVDAAIALQKGVVFYEYDKLLDATTIEVVQESMRVEGAQNLRDAAATAATFKGSAWDALSVEEQDARLVANQRLREAGAMRAATRLDTSDAALRIAHQAGVIAQELKALTKEIGAFDWLVTKREGTFAVDYDSLFSILNVATQARLDKAGF